VWLGGPPRVTSRGPGISTVPGAVATAVARLAADRPASPSTAAHGSAVSPSGKPAQKMIASAPCGPKIDLLIEILPNFSQPAVGTLSENATPAIVLESLRLRATSVRRTSSNSRVVANVGVAGRVLPSPAAVIGDTATSRLEGRKASTAPTTPSTVAAPTMTRVMRGRLGAPPLIGKACTGDPTVARRRGSAARRRPSASVPTGLPAARPKAFAALAELFSRRRSLERCARYLSAGREERRTRL
jgi:hypothetical protein